MRKINWGVLGTAGIARGCTIPGMKLAGNCNLYAIAGRNILKAEDFKTEFGFEKAYGSYEELLSDANVEAVYIPLPNELHKEWVINALKAGKHVLCEKPLAPTPEEVDEMITVANENGVFLMEAFAYLHSPIVKAIKDEVDSGIIGDIRYMETAFITSDYDISNIRMRKETFGGCTYDLGCYNISQILWMFSEEPEKVKAIAEFSDRGVDTLTSGILTFKDGKKAAFTCGMVLATEQNRRLDRLQIHGTKGKIVSDVEFNGEGEISYSIITDENIVIKTVDVPQNYKLEVEQLGKCIDEAETPHVSNDFSKMVSRTLKRVLDSIGY